MKQGANAVENEGAKVDPSAALFSEYKEAQSRAIREIRWFNPAMIVQQVETALAQQVNAVALRSGASFNPQTGDVDLRGTAMGRTLHNWLFQFAQGNRREAGVPEFRFNVRNLALVVRLYVRHRQSWGKIFPGQGPVDLSGASRRRHAGSVCGATTGDAEAGWRSGNGGIEQNAEVQGVSPCSHDRNPNL